MIKKTITKTERLQLIGLMTLAHQAYVKMEEADDAMQKVIGSDDRTLLSDEYFEDNFNVDKCLKNMDIKVK